MPETKVVGLVGSKQDQINSPAAAIKAIRGGPVRRLGFIGAATALWPAGGSLASFGSAGRVLRGLTMGRLCVRERVGCGAI